MESFLLDLNYSVRKLLGSPGFAAVAVLSLALGIGANTTIFTLINAILLQPIAAEEPARLVSVFISDEKNPGNFPMSHPNYEDYRDDSEVFSGLAAFSFVSAALSDGDEPEQVGGLMVSGNYFDVLGVQAALGRTFLPEEYEVPGTHPVVVLGHRAWTTRFGSDAEILGKTFKLNGHVFAVIGVMPREVRSLTGLFDPDIWVTTAMHQQIATGLMSEYFDDRRAGLFFVFGRLEEGIAGSQAEAALQPIAQRLERDYPEDNAGRTVTLRPLVEQARDEDMITFGALLMGVVGLILLIACANIANLLLAKATVRAREISMRLSLGATRRRLVQQLLTESGLLAMVGGATGLLVAYWGRNALWSLRPPNLQQVQVDLSLNGRVLLFTLVVSLLTGILFGLLPALRSTRLNLSEALKDRSGQAAGAGRFNVRSGLVVFQVGLSVLTLVFVGLFVRSLQKAQAVDLGFETKNLILMSFDIGAQGYDEARGQQFYRHLLERLEGIGGVESATLAANLPLTGGFLRSVRLDGQEASTVDRIYVLTNNVYSNYFETLGVPLVRGRGFTTADREGAPQVVVVNESMAEQFWPGQDPLGKRFYFTGFDDPHEVIGVAYDSKYQDVTEDPRSSVYIPALQLYTTPMTLQVRTTTRPTAVLATVRAAVRELEPEMPLTNVTTMEERLFEDLWTERMRAILLAGFGLLALALASLGIYGVTTYTVNQRGYEIGIRMALGARKGIVLRMILGQGMVLVALGIALGLLGAFGAAQLVSNVLFGVTAIDLVSYAGSAAVLLFVALLANLLPAQRATTVDPVRVLRYE